MKQLFLLMVLGTSALVIRAQGLSNFFSQSEARLKYYAEQIATLQVYIGDAEKGYKIVESGLQTIDQIKNGEFNLHSAFYTALKTVSPAVKNIAEVAEIISLQASIAEQVAQSLHTCRQSGLMSSNEITYIGNVYSSLVNAGLKDIDALTTLLTDDQLQLSDGERIDRIQGLDRDMKEQYGYMAGFTDQAGLLVQQRAREQSDNGTVGNLYGIK
jgi:hypothetical protein